MNFQQLLPVKMYFVLEARYTRIIDCQFAFVEMLCMIH